jgi:hypothetical protein
MTLLKTASREIVGLFVDDEFLALGALAVVGLAAVVVRAATTDTLPAAATLFGGCLVVLVAGVLRTARFRRHG